MTRWFPAHPHGSASPPPIIVGDGATAREIVKHLVHGCMTPGEPVTVHCLGAGGTWAVEAAAELGQLARVTWSELPMRPIPIGLRAAELTRRWARPSAQHATATGPTIVVALAREDLGMPIAAAVTAHVEAARVVVVAEEDVWPTPDGVSILTVPTGLPRRDNATHSAILDDLARLASGAPPGLGSLLGNLARDPDGAALPLTRQSVRLRERLDALVAAAPHILTAGGIAWGPAASVTSIIVTPGEVSRMASALLEALSSGGGHEERLAALELAQRLPVLLARAGWRPHRPAGYEALLTYEMIERLAPLVHHAYQDTAVSTGNATGSPWAYASWESLSEFTQSANRAVLTGAAVVHAAAGLTWRRTAAPRILEVTGCLLEQIAELEHRRWAQHQRLHGRPGHQWAVPWADLGEEQKHYDRRVSAALPWILAAAGIEVCPADDV